MGKTVLVGGCLNSKAPITTDPVFANNTWEQIIKACQSNSVPDTWVVGDQKAMTINGINYAIDIIGKNHDTYTAGGTAPLTFQMHKCYGTQYYNMNSSETNSGGWRDTVMRNTHLPAILKLMPSEVQAGIKEVNKLTSAGSNSSTINTSADKLFLLSEVEVFGTNGGSKAGEGTQYEYYKAGNSTVKAFNTNDADDWWLRSPYNSSTYFCYVDWDGNRFSTDADSVLGVAFAFCF